MRIPLCRCTAVSSTALLILGPLLSWRRGPWPVCCVDQTWCPWQRGLLIRSPPLDPQANKCAAKPTFVPESDMSSNNGWLAQISSGTSGAFFLGPTFLFAAAMQSLKCRSSNGDQGWSSSMCMVFISIRYRRRRWTCIQLLWGPPRPSWCAAASRENLSGRRLVASIPSYPALEFFAATEELE